MLLEDLIELDWATRVIGENTIIAQFWTTRIIIEAEDDRVRICRLPSYDDVATLASGCTIDELRTILDKLVFEDHGQTDTTQLGVSRA